MLRCVVQALAVDGPFGRFAGRVLTAELPDLAADRHTATLAFVCHRAGRFAGPLRLGVIALSLAVGAADHAIDPDRTARFLRTTSLPFVGELARLVRSLAFAYVWETWPDTTPTGADPTGASR